MNIEISTRSLLSSDAAPFLLLTGCGKSGGMPDITQKGVFTETGGFLVEIKQLGTLANTYGPRLASSSPNTTSLSSTRCRRFI